MLVAYDDKGRVLDFGSLEVQAVYISGNLTGPFKQYLENPNPDFEWKKGLTDPKPDYLSSSRKRLIPQIIAKGSILNQWHKKQAVALQVSFYETLPPFPEVDQINSDFAFFLYDLVQVNQTENKTLQLQKIVYTTFKAALESIAKFEAGSIDIFIKVLQKKLDAKRAGKSNLEDKDIVVE